MHIQYILYQSGFSQKSRATGRDTALRDSLWHNHGGWLSTLCQAVVFIFVAEASCSGAGSSVQKKRGCNWERARIGRSPQGHTEAGVSSLDLWLLCGCQAEAWTISHGAQHTHTWPRRSWGRIQGKVGPLQTCLLFHTNQVSQQIKDKYEEENGCCFASALYTSCESLSLWLPVPRNLQERILFSLANLSTRKLLHAHTEIKRKNKYYLKCNQCLCCQGNPGFFFFSLSSSGTRFFVVVVCFFLSISFFYFSFVKLKQRWIYKPPKGFQYHLFI